MSSAIQRRLNILIKSANLVLQKGVGNQMGKDNGAPRADGFNAWTQKVDRMAFYAIFVAYVIFIIIYTFIVSVH